MSDGNGNLRRSMRIKALVKEKPVEKQSDSSDDDDVGTAYQKFSIDKKELENVPENIQKPAELFFDDDVSGQKIYKFYTPQRKSTLLQKATLSRTPMTPKSPVDINPKVLIKRIDLKNAKVLNKQDQGLKKKVTINQRRYRSEPLSSESESISEPSDYVPSDESSEQASESEDNNEISEEGTDEETKSSKSHFKKSIATSKIPNTPKRGISKQKSGVRHRDYHMKADEYFETQSEKVITSDRTLERLKNSRLTKEKLGELLASQSNVSTIHKKSICTMTENYTALFPMWYFLLEEGYTVLLYGVGSKRCLINDFHKTVTADYPTLIVNGFFPSLTVKDVLDGIITDLLGLSSPTGVSECLTLIEKIMNKNPSDRLYLFIHNIDGIMLRSNKAQEVLSSLASIPNICTLASIDHINSPLLWDHVKRSKFNFYWWDATTFLPYQEETSFESSLLVQQSGALALSSLHNVFLSLTSNAKSIYILLAKNQLSNSGNTNFSGMAFKDLYRAAREGFLVSSDLALRAQLTEFIDHKLVKTKRNIDGVELLVIPLGNSLLKKFLEDHE